MSDGDLSKASNQQGQAPAEDAQSVQKQIQ